MRILVTSDSHGNEDNLRRAILAQPKAEIVIHLGDGETEADRMKRSFPEKMFLQVRGNCDWGSNLPTEGVYDVQGVKIFYTHGHMYGVKSGLYNAVCAAREKGASILLYGHTHLAMTDYEDGLHIMNPGSLGGWKPSYGTIDIFENSILTNTVCLG